MANSASSAVPRGVAGLPLCTRSTIGPWTLTLMLLVIPAIVGANFAGLTSLLGLAGLVAVIGLGVGVVMGSPQMRPLERGVIGFAIGCIATVSGVVISVLIVVSRDPEPLEVIPVLVALVAGVFGMVAGGACALGTLVGGFLRGRSAGHVAMA